jgi:ADP-ribosylation factor-like protein 3
MVFVVDSSDEDRLKECVEELTSLLQEETLQKVPLLIYANKQDLELALEPSEVMESLKLNEIQGRMWNIQACSAIT